MAMATVSKSDLIRNLKKISERDRSAMGSPLAKPGGSTSLRDFATIEPAASDSSSLQDEDEPLISVMGSKLVLVDEPDQHETFCVRCRTQALALPHSGCPGRSEYWSGPGGGGSGQAPAFDSDHSDLILNDDTATCLHDWDSMDHCHAEVVNSDTTSAQNQLMAASILCLLFMIGEVIGGYLAGSLAVITDAAHMMSDFASFLISLFAIWIGRRPPTKRMPFGYHRAEILGALVSIVIIWVLAGILVYLATERIRTKKYEIDADTMIIVSGIGVAINIIMGLVLHGMCHNIKHSHSHSQSMQSPVANGGHSHKQDESKNINVRAAFIHVIGDLIQSVGVLVAAYIIKYYPSYKVADPICTFIFSFLVLLTTVRILSDAVHVLMEGFPHNLNYNAIHHDLMSIHGVKAVHSLHIWSLTIGKSAVSVHLARSDIVDSDQVLAQASNMLQKKYNLCHTTVQVEKYDAAVMEKCLQCQPLHD